MSKRYNMHNLKLMRPIGGRGDGTMGCLRGWVWGGGGVMCMHKVKLISGPISNTIII